MDRSKAHQALARSTRSDAQAKNRQVLQAAWKFFPGDAKSLTVLFSTHPLMANLTDICVMRKILSSEYQLYACGKIFRKP